MSNKYFHYYVEGECERLLVNSLKIQNRYIYSGRVDVLNVITEQITKTRIRALKSGTVAVLIYDTDCSRINILRDNIERLKKSKNIHSVVCIPQYKNFEDELLRCTNVKKIEDFTKSKSRSNFKSDFLGYSEDNLLSKLEKLSFDIKKLWVHNPRDIFCEFGNKADKIKRK